jgi:hypothetical protein
VRDVVYSDCEASSLRDPHLPGGRRVWEVALIRQPADGGRPLCAWLQITDVDLDDADPRSLAVGRFAQRFHPEAYGPVGPQVTPPWRDGRPVMLWGCEERHAAATIAELTDGAVIAGSNPRYDMDSFADLLRRHGAEPSWYHHPLDVPNAALGWLRARHPAGWADPSYPTSLLSEACGVPVPADRHSAWADAAWVRAWDRTMAGLE